MSSLGWTHADQAEWDAVCWTLVNGIARHKPRCRACLEHRYCEGSEAAISEAVDWLYGRRLLSKAQWLRIQ